jgi:hypothetical protein
MKEVVLLVQELFGMACIITAVWLFVDVLRANKANLNRIRRMSRVAAILMRPAFLIPD